MSNLPAKRRTTQGDIRHLPRVGALDLYAAMLADAKCVNTRNGREHDIRVFAKFLGRDKAEACALFVGQGRANANAIGMAFRQAMQEAGKASGTINRRLSTIRRLARLARRFDLIEWAPDIDDLPTVSRKDTRGPSVEEWKTVWSFVVNLGDDPQARRIRALLRLLHDSALRKSEALGIDMDDLDLAGARALIRGKGSHDKAWITLSPTCVGLIREWIRSRGKEPGPLFVSHVRVDVEAYEELDARISELRSEGLKWEDVCERLNDEDRLTPYGLRWTVHRMESRIETRRRRHPYQRMGERDVNYILHWISRECGIERPVKPHGIRHTAITRALDLNNGDIRKVQRFARHSKPETTIRYDDNRRDMAGEVTRQLGDD